MLTAVAVVRKMTTASVTERVFLLYRIAPWNRLWKTLVSGQSNAKISPIFPNSTRSGDNPLMAPNHNPESGVKAINAIPKVIAPASTHEKRRIGPEEPGSSSNATTTSRKAIPADLKRNTRPERTPQTAREEIARGILLIEALNTGWAIRKIREVKARGI
jgi:hypothetical protein